MSGLSRRALRPGRAARHSAKETLRAERDAARLLVSETPDGLLVVRDGVVCSVNRRACELLGFDRGQLVGATAPYPFWPPEHRHELERWQAELEAPFERETEQTFRHRNGQRLRVLVSRRHLPDGGGRHGVLLAVRDVSTAYRREARLAQLATRDPETGLLNRDGFEERLLELAGRAISGGTNMALILAGLGVTRQRDGLAPTAPEALAAVERLRTMTRAGDELARPRDQELAWILPGVDSNGGVGFLARMRIELASLGDVTLTAGVCDLASAGDGLMLYALAGEMLARAGRHGSGGTAQYTPAGAFTS